MFMCHQSRSALLLVAARSQRRLDHGALKLSCAANPPMLRNRGNGLHFDRAVLPHSPIDRLPGY